MAPEVGVRSQQTCIIHIYKDIFDLYSKARAHRCWLPLSATQIRQAGGCTVAQELDTMMTDTEALLLDCNTFLQELWNYMETLNDKLGNDYVPLLDIDSVLSSNMGCMCKALNWKWTMHHAINGYMELQAQMPPNSQFANLVPGVHTIDLTDTEETETESEPETWAQCHPLSESADHRVLRARQDELADE